MSFIKTNEELFNFLSRVETRLQQLEYSNSTGIVAAHIYVSPTTGSDTNDGSFARPVATFAAAEALIPYTIEATYVIHLASGTYINPRIRDRKLNAPLIVIGDGAGQPGDDGFVVQASSTADVGSSLGFLSKAGLTVDQYRGMTIQMLTGPAAGDRRLISYNTTTGIVPSRDFTGTPGTGDSYRILKPGAVFGITDVANSGELVLVEGCGSPDANPSSEIAGVGSVTFINIEPRLSGAATGTVGISLKSSNVCFLGVQHFSNTTIQIRVDGGSLALGINGSDATKAAGVYGLSFLGAASSTSWLGWGWSSVSADASSSIQSWSSGVIDGYMVTTRGVVFREDTTFNIRGGSFSTQGTQVPFACLNGARGFAIGGTNTPILFESISTPTSAIRVQDNSKLGLAAAAFNVPTAGASAIRADFGGVVELAGTYSIKSGGSIGGYGLLSAWGGKMYSSSFAAWPLVGTLGDASVENHSGFSLSTLSTTGKMAVGTGLILRL